MICRENEVEGYARSWLSCLSLEGNKKKLTSALQTHQMKKKTQSQAMKHSYTTPNREINYKIIRKTKKKKHF